MHQERSDNSRDNKSRDRRKFSEWAINWKQHTERMEDV